MFIFAALVSGCGAGVSPPASPTSPTSVPSLPLTPLLDATQPSLSGAWRGSVDSHAVRAGTNTTVGFALNCSQRWEISSQSGGHFEGVVSSEGNGPESDWRCTESRPFAGELTPDNQVTIVFSPGFTPGGCANIEGGQRAVGVRSGNSIIVDLPYRATCEMLPGGPRLDLEIASTVTLTPW
jgi:hypothetical protein